VARSLGVTQLCIAVNKLDLVGWSEERFYQICEKLLPYLVGVGYKQKNIQFVPISGLKGLNLENRESQPEELKKWYNEAKMAEYQESMGFWKSEDAQKPEALCLTEAL